MPLREMEKFCNPVKILVCDDFAKDLTDILGVSQKRGIALVCSRRFQGTEFYNSIKNRITAFDVISNIEENPSFQSCQRAVEQAKEIDPEVVIAIGGGSVMDTAKAVVKALNTRCFDINELVKEGGEVCKRVLFIAAPTTHGTGSEVTMWATIWNKDNKRKYSVSEKECYPDYALYDTRLVMTLPLKYSIISTLDALSHAFEALWNKNADQVSDQYAFDAIPMIVENLDGLKEKVSVDTRQKLLKASRLAGLAMSHTKTAAAHSISYPLTMRFDVPHGIACSMPLFPLMAINSLKVQDKLDRVYQASGCQSGAEFSGRIKNFLVNKVPYHLKEYGVKKEDLGELVGESFTKGRMDNNIVDLKEGDVLKILEAIY